MTKSVHHIGDDKRPGVQIDFAAKVSLVRGKRGTKQLVKSDREVDRAINVCGTSECNSSDNSWSIA